MRGNRPASHRRSGGGVLPPRVALLLLACALLPLACRVPQQDTLVVLRTIPLPEGDFTSFALTDDGGAWIAGSPGVVRVDTEGGLQVRAELPEGASYYLLAAPEAGLVAVADTLIALLDGRSGEVLARSSRPVMPPLRLDPAGRFLLASGDAGALVAHRLPDLVPAWGWAAVGAATTSLAFLSRGERALQGVAGQEGPPEVLYRDVQTGRTLRRVERAEPVHALEVGIDGSVYGVGWREGAGGSVFALDWRDGQLEQEWSTSLAELDLMPPVRMRLSPSGQLLAVFSGRDEAGLRVLDPGTGEVLDRYTGIVLDAAFGDGDRLVLLTPGELQEVG